MLRNDPYLYKVKDGNKTVEVRLHGYKTGRLTDEQAQKLYDFTKMLKQTKEQNFLIQ